MVLLSRRNPPAESTAGGAKACTRFRGVDLDLGRRGNDGARAHSFPLLVRNRQASHRRRNVSPRKRSRVKLWANLTSHSAPPNVDRRSAAHSAIPSQESGAATSRARDRGRKQPPATHCIKDERPASERENPSVHRSGPRLRLRPSSAAIRSNRQIGFRHFHNRAVFPRQVRHRASGLSDSRLTIGICGKRRERTKVLCARARPDSTMRCGASGRASA